MSTTTDRPGARRGRPRRDEVGARRAAILDVAIAQLAEHGFAGTTIEGVAAAAGATKRTIYSQFTDKPGLFLAAVERLHRHEQEGLLAGDDLEEVATRVVHTLLGDDAVTLHHLVVAESRRLPRLAADFYARGPARTVGALASLLAAQHPELDEPAALAEELYTLLLGEPHRRRLLGLEAAPSAARARERAQRAIRTVLGRAAAPPA